MERLFAGHGQDRWRSTCWWTDAGLRERPPISPGHAPTSVHRRRAGGAAAATPASERARARSRLARRAPQFPPSAPLARKPGMPPRAATSRGCARPPLTRRRGSVARGILCARPRAPTVPCHLRTPRGRCKSRDTLGAASSPREEAPDQVGTPPAATQLLNHRLPPRQVARPPQAACPFSRKAPSPLSLQCTHLRLGAVPLALHAAVPRHVHACARCRARLAPLASRRPQPACAHGRGGATSEAPNALHSRREGPSSGNFARRTSVPPAFPPEPGRGLPPSGGRTPHGAAAARTARARRPPQPPAGRGPAHRPSARPALACAPRRCGDSGSRRRPAAPPRRSGSGRARRRGGGGGSVPGPGGGGKAGWNPAERPPLPRAPATGLLRLPAAASVPPGAAGPPFVAGGEEGLAWRSARRRGRRRARGAAAPAAGACPARPPRGSGWRQDARPRPRGSVPPDFRGRAGSLTGCPGPRGEPRAPRAAGSGCKFATPRFGALTGSPSDSRGGYFDICV